MTNKLHDSYMCVGYGCELCEHENCDMKAYLHEIVNGYISWKRNWKNMFNDE